MRAMYPAEAAADEPTRKRSHSRPMRPRPQLRRPSRIRDGLTRGVTDSGSPAATFPTAHPLRDLVR